MPEKNVELSSAIAHLRKQLQEAIKEGEGQDLRFAVQEIEVEFQCTVKNEGGGKLGVKFWVINADAKGSIDKETIQTVKLKLLPINKEGKPTLLSSIDEVK